MKRFFSLVMTVTMVALLSVSCNKNKPEPEPEPQKTPVVTISNPIIEVAIEGGNYEISYSVENPVEKATVSIETECEWVKDFDYSTPNIVKFFAQANELKEEREAKLYFRYTYEDSLVIEKEVLLQQTFNPYDKRMVATTVVGAFFSGRNSLQANYAIYLTDGEIGDDSSLLPSTQYYRIDFHSDIEPTGDYDNIPIPEGHYTYDDLDIDMTRWLLVNDAGDALAGSAYMQDADITITRDGENVVIEAILTDETGLTHCINFKGQVKLQYLSAYGHALITRDVELGADTYIVNASYLDDNNKVMAVNLQMSDYTDVTSKPFSICNYTLYAPYDNYKLLPGTYKIDDTQEAYTIAPGYIDPSTLACMDTYIRTEDGADIRVGLLVSGEVVIEENNGVYSVDVNLQTKEGYKFTGHYDGAIKIPNIPGEHFSTLTGDHEVDFTGASTFGTFWGSKYGESTSYFQMSFEGPFEQNPDTYLMDGKGEIVYFELVTDASTAEDGIPAGTYTVGSDKDNPKVNELIPGYQNELGQGVMYGTYYIGAYENGYPSICAGAMTGELTVERDGANYIFDFSFYDDLGNRWYGHWEGEFIFYDFSGFGAPKPAEKSIETEEMIILPLLKMIW